MIFFIIFMRKTVSAETEIKTNSRIPAKMNQREGTRAG
jgi:hypothetical protein